MQTTKEASTRITSGLTLLVTVLVIAPQLACDGGSGAAMGTGGRTSGGQTSSGGQTASGGTTGKGGTTTTGGTTGSGGAAGSAGSSANGGSAGTAAGGTAGARTGGTAGARTGGTAGAGTGGTAGVATGGTAGARTGGTAGSGTGGTAGSGTGGTAGAATGGTAGAATGGTAGSGTGGIATGGTGGTGIGAEIYVSPSGDDTADGSIDHPLKTLTAARDMADKRKANNTPVTVYLRAGTHYLGAPVELGPTNSGTATAPITYAAYGSEKPVISGGIKVTPTWSTSSGNVKVATIDKNLKVDQLFLNGKRQILARYPNYNANTKILDGYAADAIDASRVSRWADPAEGPGYVRALHGNQWGGNSFIITGKSGSTVSTKWVGDNNRGSGMHAQYRMVENIFEELDAAGEWYYRKSTGELFFYPPSGTNLDGATIELASQDELFRVVGTAAAKVQYITFKGLTFTHTYRTLFSKPYELLLKGDWGIARAGAVFLTHAENIQVDSCLFDQIGGNGIFASGYNRNHRFVNNDFEDAGANCIALVGLLSAVRCGAKNFDDNVSSCTDKEPGPKTEDYPASVLVENNTMFNLGRFEKQVAGVEMSMTRKNTVRHNTIHTMPRAGINFNDGCWGGHLVEWNWVYDVVRETSDHGPFNAWGRDRNFVFQNDPAMTKIDAVDTTTVQNNRFESPVPMFGIDLDDQASNYVQTNNLLIGGGLKVQWTRYNTYVNNIIVGGGVIDVHSPWTSSNHTVKNNILVGDVAYSLFSISNLSTDIASRVPNIDYNLFYNNGKDPRICNWMDRASNPFTWAQWKAAGLDKNSVLADPMFVNPSAGDYTVKDGSPALALGFKNFPMTGFGATKAP